MTICMRLLGIVEHVRLIEGRLGWQTALLKLRLKIVLRGHMTRLVEVGLELQLALLLDLFIRRQTLVFLHRFPTFVLIDWNKQFFKQLIFWYFENKLKPTFGREYPGVYVKVGYIALKVQIAFEMIKQWVLAVRRRILRIHKIKHTFKKRNLN